MKKKDNFKPSAYTIHKEDNKFFVKIEGQKLAPPSKRITFNQPGIKVLSAKIIHKHKKGDIEFEIIRINHLKSFGEVRLHVNSMLYPGSYTITMEFSGELDTSDLGQKII
jgi:hypothetical protein